MRVHTLTCNYFNNPIGVESPNPSLSWQLDEVIRQTAYQIIVGSGPGGSDVWDSGKIESDRSVQLAYAGSALVSRQLCHWRVRVWNEDGIMSDWSETATWEMGLLRADDWSARWIADGRKGVRPASEPQPAPYLRRTIDINKQVECARAYVSGLGYGELYLNGRKVSDDVLSPGFTKYDNTILYCSYDITEKLHEGKNGVGVILGTGWYNSIGDDVWQFHNAPWRDQSKLLLQLEITYADGSTDTIGSDPTWRHSTGPIVFNALRCGETYDARLELVDWSTAGFDDSAWESCCVVPAPGGMLRSQQQEAMQVTETVSPAGLREVEPGVWLYDLGQNIAGWAQLTVEGPAGTCVEMAYGELLSDDDKLDQSNISNLVKGERKFSLDTYTLRGEGQEVWEPRFTYHGFQYVQVTGFPGTPSLDSLRGRVVHTAFASRGSFECSNDLLNKIQQCTLWSTRGNFHGMPTDCPHREKNGWTGDAQLSAEHMLLNFAPMASFRKWMGDFRDAQRASGQLPGIVPTGGWGFNWGSGPAWDSALILIPWYTYLYCGDTQILADNYEAMKRYLVYCQSMATDHIVDFGLGDWCPPEGGPSSYKCPTAVTDTAYYYSDVSIIAQIAVILDNEEEAKHFGQLATEIRAAFRERFIDLDSAEVEGNCQTSVATALFQGLLEADEIGPFNASLARHVEAADRHIDCGILGTKYVMHALADAGRGDLGYAIANQTTFPSWGHWIEQGATTLWEMWDGRASHNHHMFGDVSAWFYKCLAGINPDPKQPGFKHSIIRPAFVEDLDWVKAEHQTPYGPISVNWERNGGQITLTLSIPSNTTATLVFDETSQELTGGLHKFTF